MEEIRGCVKMEEERSKEEILLEELKREQKSVEIPDENIRMMLEEIINKKALKIGRKVLDEIYLHGEDKIEVSIRKSDTFNWFVVYVDVHGVTGLHDEEKCLIRREGLREMSLNDFEIKEVVEEK